MEFPDVFNMPEDQARDVIQAYVAGMLDEKESIMALINGLKNNSKNPPLVTTAYEELLTVLRTESPDGQ
jgi:hypothetical protein